jgi:CheY-like chemotaxis protein
MADPASQVPDSNEARHYISKRRRDILLSNMEMLGVHGIEMLKLARNDGRTPFAVL